MRKHRNILVVTYWSFGDALIQTYTLPYIKQIRSCTNGKIYLLCLSKVTLSLKEKEQIATLEKENIFLVNFSYNSFGLLMALKLVYIVKYLALFSWIKKIDCIHAWCTPGGAIGYLISVITGKPLILDSFEPHAETMVEGNTWRKQGVAYKLLFRLEKLQLKRASEVICAAKGMIMHSQELYKIVKSRYFVKPACVDLELFNPSAAVSLKNLELTLKSNICVYAGKFGGIYLQQEVFEFFKAAYDYWKGDFSVLLLTSHTDEEIRAYCAQVSLPREVIVKRLVAHSEVPKYMALATFGFCPVKPLPSKRFCTPIKNGEYWAMGLPVVITKNISDDSRLIAENDIGYVLQELSGSEYVKAINTIDRLKNEQQIKEKIRAIAIRERNFKVAEEVYKAIYA